MNHGGWVYEQGNWTRCEQISWKDDEGVDERMTRHGYLPFDEIKDTIYGDIHIYCKKDHDFPVVVVMWPFEGLSHDIYIRGLPSYMMFRKECLGWGIKYKEE